jgi:hypothetical protein
MKIVTGCQCGKTFTEKNFKGPMGRPKLFGLPNNMMGNARSRFIKLVCECGSEYLGECVPGKSGGSMRLNRIIDTEKEIKIQPPQPKPAPEPEPPVIPEPEELEVEEEVEIEVKEKPDVYSEPTIEDMTRAQLIELAKDRNIPGLARMTKAELISVVFS